MRCGCWGNEEGSRAGLARGGAAEEAVPGRKVGLEQPRGGEGGHPQEGEAPRVRKPRGTGSEVAPRNGMCLRGTHSRETTKECLVKIRSSRFGG